MNEYSMGNGRLGKRLLKKIFVTLQKICNTQWTLCFIRFLIWMTNDNYLLYKLPLAGDLLTPKLL